MRRRPLVDTVMPVVAAAVLGNAFLPRESQRWFRRLRQPKLAIPFPAFVTVGAVYYVLLGVVRYRAVAHEDVAASRLALTVLALNEGWNVVFFGRQSTRNGFFGVLAFTVPVIALQKAVADDRISTLALAPPLGSWRTTSRGPTGCGVSILNSVRAGAQAGSPRWTGTASLPY